MKPIPTDIARTLTARFPGVQDTALYSALQGHMGRVLGSEQPPLDFVYANCGEYHYFGGNPDHPQAEALIRGLPAGAYLVSFEEAWKALFTRLLAGRHEVQERYMLQKNMDALDEKKLEGFFSAVPEGFRLVAMDGPLFRRVLPLPWAHEYLEQYASEEDFCKQGFGFALLQGEEAACIAPAFSVFDEGIEVGIATNPAFRKRGLATVCAARLVYEAKRRGLLANWDAANKLSLHLAMKLGYAYEGTYTVHHLLS